MSHYKGILLAGGAGSRLYPLTQVTSTPNAVLLVLSSSKYNPAEYIKEKNKFTQTTFSK